MNSMLCSRCKKRLAVVFVSRMEGDKTYNEGLCLQCAKELGIKPVEDLMSKMGITDDQLDAMSEQLMNPDAARRRRRTPRAKIPPRIRKRAAQSRRKIKRRRKSS